MDVFEAQSMVFDIEEAIKIGNDNREKIDKILNKIHKKRFMIYYERRLAVPNSWGYIEEDFPRMFKINTVYFSSFNGTIINANIQVIRQKGDQRPKGPSSTSFPIEWISMEDKELDLELREEARQREERRDAHEKAVCDRINLQHKYPIKPSNITVREYLKQNMK